MKTYSDLIKLSSFEDRFEMLKLYGTVGVETFGHSRYLNQIFYRSKEWKKVRDYVIMRDEGCDLACSDRPIRGTIIVHHISPVTEQQVIDREESIMDPELLVCCSHITHNAIHYGDATLLFQDPVVRKPNDTRPW